MASEIVTGSSLLEDRLPNLRYGTDKTHAPSLKGEYCLLPLAVWDKFEYRVRKHCDGLQKMDEMVKCGDEHSVVARFGQHVGQVMTTIFQQTESAKNVYFGDYKTYNNPTGSGKCPDIAVLERDQLLFVGEAKTPWAHKPGDLDTVNDVEFRKYLGT
ncbi:unnamed protein product [Penicillium salamii]|uniref:Uncharacterized protein n=1 Tax=Penicillium salamii TaxID=1612424 RepID=A0A9W4IEC0_9EURO|nr:unnamed protein product [Penicillium salamii]CAG8420056.1 unnamed protein product [Penicillium salamii]CAG8420590.1 unnamed protein product [Penicillium salamii]